MKEPLYSMLVIACFSRRVDVLDAAGERLRACYGATALVSPDFDFHQTKYYEATMGADLRKRLLVFEALVEPDCLPTVKRETIALEAEFMQLGHPEARPLNVDPGLMQLGKFLLATTKDQSQRIYLRDGIFAEVTLKYQGGTFEPWPWTYADYREPEVISFLNHAREYFYGRVVVERSRGDPLPPPTVPPATE